VAVCSNWSSGCASKTQWPWLQNVQTKLTTFLHDINMYKFFFPKFHMSLNLTLQSSLILKTCLKGLTNFYVFKWYIEHERPCLTTFSNTKKRVENTLCSRVFLTNFEMFGNVVKHCLEYLILSSQSKLKLRRKRRNTIVKIYAN